MKNLVSTEKMLKHWLKKRVTITTATVVGFLLMGTAAFGETIMTEPKLEGTDTKIEIKEGETYGIGLKYSHKGADSHKKITLVENNGTILIDKYGNLKEESAIILQEERKEEIAGKEIINNGLIKVLIKNEDAPTPKPDRLPTIIGVKLLGDSRIENNGTIDISSPITSYGVAATIVGYKFDKPVIVNNGIITISGDSASNALTLSNRGEKELKVINNGTLEANIIKGKGASVVSFINDRNESVNRAVSFDKIGRAHV